MTRPRVLAAVDRLTWCFFNIAQAKTKYLSDEFEFTILPYPEAKGGDYDIGVAYWWSSLRQIVEHNRIKRRIMCLYDHYSWSHPDRARRMCELAKFAHGIAVANEDLAANHPVRDFVPTYLCEDGVHTDRFLPSPLPAEFTVGWVGHPMQLRTSGGVVDLKGLGLIEQACRKVGVPLRTLKRGSKEQLTHDQMPSYYAGVSTYVCASLNEGTPNPVLEAMSCGRPVVTTKVGLTEKIVRDGENGLFIGRSVDEIADRINQLRSSLPDKLADMANTARRSALLHDWSIKAEAWRKCLRAVMETP